jgi:hypothetical protein
MAGNHKHIKIYRLESQLTPRYTVCLEKLIDNGLIKKFYAFMEPKASSQCSKKLITGLYAESTESNSYPHPL